MNTLDERLLTVMDVLHTPVWVYDIQRHHIYWANDAALGLWEASSLAELKSRDFSADMAAAIDLLLQRYLGDFQQERSYNEWWTLSPKGVKKQVYLRLSGIQLAGRQMMMAEAVIDADTLYQESSLATGDTLACLFDNEGRLESGNHHFDMCFGTGILTLPQIFSGADEAFYRRLSRLDEVVAEGECRTQKGMRWFQYQFRHIQQGARILLTMRDITDRKLEELEHRHLAWHDSLTGLLNRYGLMKSLEAYCGLGGALPWCSWIWTTSSWSMTTTATRPGIACWSGSPDGSSRSARGTWSWRALAGTSSPPWCPSTRRAIGPRRWRISCSPR